MSTLKTNIILCPHFHQPHFQLYRTREEAFANCYQPWLDLINDYAGKPGFFINMHFSGPFMSWMAREKSWYLDEWKKLIKTGGVGVIGGLADEPFIQLSSRPDDTLFQMREYERMTAKFLGIEAADWQGIHVVEREAGEWLLYGLSQGAKQMGAKPVFYLDAETYYQPYYSYPGGPYDYCRRHFGFDDAYSKTTVSHLPQEILYFAMRDEIGGQEFFGIPIHTQFRYRFLKRQAFGDMDRTVVSPKQYLFYIKDAAEKAAQMAERLGRSIEPAVLIFEDAEKFGQWSKDPEGDTKWMRQFFKLIEKDNDVKLCGLRDYVEEQGCLETYAVNSSHSYPEWENWTAKRGIRGVTTGDERLRKVISRQRDLESKIASLEDSILSKAQPAEWLSKELWLDTVLGSNRRYEVVEALLKRSYPKNVLEAYRKVQRIRNLVYQEDPRWASRHPSYGSCAYFDLNGLSYLEIAERIIDIIAADLKDETLVYPEVQVRDWDADGRDDVMIRTAFQTVVIDVECGEISYQSAIAAEMNDLDQIIALIVKDMNVPIAYTGIQKVSYPLIFTEADSDLCHEFNPEGARLEKCRNSFRTVIKARIGSKLVPVDQTGCPFKVVSIDNQEGAVKVNLIKNLELKEFGQGVLQIKKTFIIRDSSVFMSIEINNASATPGINCVLVPELVTSASPSDEVDFQPNSWLGMNCDDFDSECEIHVVPVDLESSTQVPREIAYVFEFKTGSGESFENTVFWDFATNDNIERVEIKPAVNYYYRGHVFPDQSKLGFDSSGIMIKPYIRMNNGECRFESKLSWEFNSHTREKDYQDIVVVLGSAKE
ncbi:MAG: hypothetical protein ACM3PP_13305 [Candidatus Saccharibacteria bacterium]